MSATGEPQRVPFRAVFDREHVWLSLAILAGTVVGSMDSYIVNTSMPRVLGDLGQPEFYAWVASAFILAQVVGLSVGGAWKDRSGVRLPFVVTTAAFGLGSLLCAFAPSMEALVAARTFQGLAGGGLMAVSVAAAAGHPEGLRLRMFSMVSSVWGVVALAAPLLGGVITDTLGWRWIFFVNVPLCALVVLLGWRALPAETQSGRGRSLPVLRAVLLALAVGALSAAPSAGWYLAIPVFAVGLGLGWLYLRNERRAKVPVIPLETWTGRGPLGSSLLASMFYTGSYVAGGVFLPLYLVNVRGESDTQAGLILSVGGCMWTVGSLVASNLSRERWGMRMIVGGALLIALAGGCVAAQAALGDLPLAFLYVTWAAAGFGIGLAMLHLMNWSIVYAPPEQTGVISGAVQTMRMLGQAVGAALLGALLNAIGAEGDRLRLSITVIFLVVPLLALWPATFGRPKFPEAGAAAMPTPEAEPRHAAPVDVG